MQRPTWQEGLLCVFHVTSYTATWMALRCELFPNASHIVDIQYFNLREFTKSHIAPQWNYMRQNWFRNSVLSIIISCNTSQLGRHCQIECHIFYHPWHVSEFHTAFFHISFNHVCRHTTLLLFMYWYCIMSTSIPNPSYNQTISYLFPYNRSSAMDTQNRHNYLCSIDKWDLWMKTTRWNNLFCVHFISQRGFVQATSDGAHHYVRTTWSHHNEYNARWLNHQQISSSWKGMPTTNFKKRTLI